MEARSIDGVLATVDAPEQELQNVNIDVFMCIGLFDFRRYARPARFLGYFSFIQAYSLSSLQSLTFTNSLRLYWSSWFSSTYNAFLSGQNPEYIHLSGLANSS